MFQLDILSLIPKALKRQAADTAVDFIAAQAEKFLSNEISTKIKSLRSNATFQANFEAGLQRAGERFVAEYATEDEDVVAALAGDRYFFQDEDVQQALLDILKKPGQYLADERAAVVRSFDRVLPNRLNRDRVDRAVVFFLKCLAEEVWNLPELRPAYELQFQRMTAEGVREQVALQKAQIQAMAALSADMQGALLQLTDAVAEQRLLPGGESGAEALTAPVHHNLPQPDFDHFIGRQAELKQIRQLLSPKTRHFVITIDGIGGIGKSALALEVAHSYLRYYDQLPEAERFAAIIWTTAKQTVLTGEGIITRSKFLRTLDDIYATIDIVLERENVTRTRPEDWDELVHQALTQQRTLLIIDNLETVDDERVRSFIREVPDPTKVLVTTRHRLDVAYPVRVVGMPIEDALDLITNEAEKKGVMLTDEEAKLLYERTGGVPLAMVWSVAQMGFGYDVPTVLKRLGQPNNDVTKFCFEAALEQIEEKPAHKILLALSLFATDASRKALGRIIELPEMDRDDGLVMLEKLSLLNKIADRFDLLPLTETFANAHLESHPEEKRTLQLAFIRYFLDVSRKYGGDQWQLYKNLDQEIKNIQLAMEWTYQLEMWPEVGEFADNVVEFLDRRGLWNELVAYGQMAIEAGLQTNNKPLIMRHKLFSTGWARVTRFDQLDEGMASIQEGKALAHALKDERGYATALYDEGTFYRKSSQLDRAETLIQQSRDLWRKLGDHRWEARATRGLGRIAKMRGDLQSAYAYYAKSLEKAEAVGDIEQTALNLSRMSNVLWHWGRFDEAHKYTKKALALCEQLNIINGIANCCLMLAKIEASLGRIEQARAEAQKAYALFADLRSSQRLETTAALLASLEN